MEKKIIFKIKEKYCKIIVELKLENGRFSVSGGIWNNKIKDYEICGQCLDTLKTYLPNDELFTKIHRLWKNYHLNDMQAGTPEQMEAVKDIEVDWYENACKRLKELDLYIVRAENADLYRKENSSNMGKPYKFGSEWLTFGIPERDLLEIKSLFE